MASLDHHRYCGGLAGGPSQDGFAAAGGFLTLACDAWLLEIFAAARLGQYAVLLYLFVEAAQRTLEALVVPNYDVSHYIFHPLRSLSLFMLFQSDYRARAVGVSRLVS